MQHLMPLLIDVLKYHISYQFKSKFKKLNKYSFAYNFYGYRHSSVPPIHGVYMVKPTPRNAYVLCHPNLESRQEGTYSYS